MPAHISETMPSSFPISDHCDGNRFYNPGVHINRNWWDVLRWRLTSRAEPWPQTVEIKNYELPSKPNETGLTCTWINHATTLLRSATITWLIDPVFSPCAGPWGRWGPRRAHRPGIGFDNLPFIDVVLLSHDHYDHCDLPSLERLYEASQPLAITPLGNGRLLKRAGFPARRIVELDWWQTHKINDQNQITLTPARHWSNRLSGKRNARLWGGFYLQTGDRRVASVGDTGYDDQMFRDIHQRLGAPDLALIPIGAYEPRWFMDAQHCNPDEAVQIHRDLNAKRSIGVHWGTFQLTDEGREAPLKALAATGISENEFRALDPGQTICV